MKIQLLQNIETRHRFIRQLADIYPCLAVYESNGYEDRYGTFSWAIAVSKGPAMEFNENSYSSLLTFLKSLFVPSDAPIRPVFLSYTAKNIYPGMHSSNDDKTGFPTAAWFEPDWVVAAYRSGEMLEWGKSDALIDIENEPDFNYGKVQTEPFTPSLTRTDYMQAFHTIQEHLKRGNIYEMNFCLHFSTKASTFCATSYFKRLNEVSPAPMAVLFKLNNAWVISSSPERFLTGNKETLISQPIKGTAKRGTTELADTELKDQLRNDKKETAENVMIVDLVRNDLSHFAKRGSVQVEELFGVYAFPQVYQMISTVRCELRSSNVLPEAILKAFPMGSMTGVPKLSAMRIAEELEKFARGPYSGSIGYVCPDGSFDLNVVIRSATWNEENKYLSFSAGSAITIRSEAEKEYEECLLKAKTLYQVMETETPWLKE
jgi:para-aminobenzoate synthetase component 1